MITKRYIIPFFICVIVALSGFSQVKIHGKVIDEENKPLEFATVRIHKTALGTNTNLDGDYSISTAEIDTIDIVFSCIGYKTEKRQLIKA